MSWWEVAKTVRLPSVSIIEPILKAHCRGSEPRDEFVVADPTSSSQPASYGSTGPSDHLPNSAKGLDRKTSHLQSPAHRNLFRKAPSC